MSDSRPRGVTPPTPFGYWMSAQGEGEGNCCGAKFRRHAQISSHMECPNKHIHVLMTNLQNFCNISSKVHRLKNNIARHIIILKSMLLCIFLVIFPCVLLSVIEGLCVCRDKHLNNHYPFIHSIICVLRVCVRSLSLLTIHFCYLISQFVY